MSANPLKRLMALGQSVWLDYIRRDLLHGPELRRLIEEDGLGGMTSNPTIFQKAIAGTELYDDDIFRLAGKDRTPAEILDTLVIDDVRAAADVFRPVYDATNGNDGFVSIEVRPQLARDFAGSVAEARRLWKACDRPNVMVKIPATDEGIGAIRRCLADGININITLLFSVARYREVMEAYLSAMEERVAAGLPVDGIRSVASFFVSRVDTVVNSKLDGVANDLKWRVAIANARIAYEAFEGTFAGARFAKLREQGVRPQRPLWASTSTKDPDLPDIYYVEALVAPDSVDTMPPETLDAYRHHGDPKIRIREDLPAAHAMFMRLSELRIDEREMARELEEEGARKFVQSWDAAVKAIKDKVESRVPQNLAMLHQ